MRILFFMRHAGYTRNFESTLRLLADRGHRIYLAFDKEEGGRLTGSASALRQEYPNIGQGQVPRHQHDRWTLLGERLRAALDYLRYLEPRYADATKLRERVETRVVGIVRRLARSPLGRTAVGFRLLQRSLQILERAVPISPKIERFIQKRRPDLILVTPLVELGSPQTNYLRVAKQLGIRTGLCVYSWDNLTNKGLMHEVPDFVTVWNEAQKREAVELHGVPPKRVVVTGATPYDHWFDWAPGTTREEFCGRVGLDPNQPFLLYMCSSFFIAPDEASYVVGWLRRLRAVGGALAQAGVLIRPHPQNAGPWATTDLGEFENVAVWPRGGADPADTGTRTEFYDSIYHSAAVVGVNTSAQIESAILGRPVHTLLADEFRDTQEGTLHFHHLTGEGGGLLHVASTFEEHAAQLAESLAAQGQADSRTRPFLEAFVRPHGLDVAATPRLVAAIEKIGRQPAPAPARGPSWAPLLRPLLAPLAYQVALARAKANQRKRVVA